MLINPTFVMPEACALQHPCSGINLKDGSPAYTVRQFLYPELIRAFGLDSSCDGHQRVMRDHSQLRQT